ncbi:asparaginase [Curtobacterium ammoniigenes]|uniref:asparaginase n=1 Tax=Curtobacterium ammoniigenes TaxID=395387 RepID=UPI0008373A83|nr:asparaginase [Curtobacterium ammoniigenes]
MTGSSFDRDRHPLSVEGSVELAVVRRSGFDESRHIGAGVVVDLDGTPVLHAGDIDASIYPRSTMKPFQAIATMRLGAGFHGLELVLSTASHAGTPAHQQVVRTMLDRFGFAEDDLGCPTDFPFDRATARVMSEPRRLTMNCSGKHAAMLAACAAQGWPTDNYLDTQHPLQVAIRATVSEYTGEEIDTVGVDGCGAPVFPTTLRGLARGIARVVSGADPDGAALTAAILEHAWAIDGPGRANTRTIERLGIVAKLGAEGVMVMGVPGRGAVAVKVLDGGGRAGSIVALRLLTVAGMIDEEAAAAAADELRERTLGGGVPVGAIEVSEQLDGALERSRAHHVTR